MARTLRIEFPGAIYHVTVRTLGQWQQERNLLFRDDLDRERFVFQLAERVGQFKLRLYLFCLMSNHVHLLVETPAPNLSKFMQSLSTAYTVYYNRRHKRHGHLLAGRYKARLVEGDAYLLKLSRYVHLNPIKVGSIAHQSVAEKISYLRRYAWSTYPSYIGARGRLDFVDYGPMLAQLAVGGGDGHQSYREYVESGLAKSDEELARALKRSGLCIGEESFCGWVLQRYQSLVKQSRRPEDVSFRQLRQAVGPDRVLEVLAEVLQVGIEEFRKRRRNSNLRGLAAWLLCSHAGLTERAAAAHLAIGNGSAVSRQLRVMRERLRSDKGLRRLLAKVERGLENAGNGSK